MSHRTRPVPALSAALVAVLLVVGTLGLAFAEDAKVKSMSLDVKTGYKAEINIASSNGSKWDTFLPGPIQLWAHMKVDTKYPGWVVDGGIFLGHCLNTGCAPNIVLYRQPYIPGSRDYNKQDNFFLYPDKTLAAGIGKLAVAPYGQQILQGCNARLQPDGATKAHAFDFTMTLSYSVNTRKGVSEPFVEAITEDTYYHFNGGDHTARDNFTVKVNCLAAPEQAQAPPPPPKRKVIQVKEIKVFLATISQPGTSGFGGPGFAKCKPLKVTTRIRTDKAGRVNVKLWNQKDNGPITQQTKAMQATSLGGGEFGADWVKWENFTKTTYAQYKAEVLGGTFAPSTLWKDITVHCGGGLTNAPKPNTDLPLPTTPSAQPNFDQPTNSLSPSSRPVDPLPTPSAPNNPTTTGPTMLELTPPLVCAGGRITKKGRCRCAGPLNKRIQTGPNAYRCKRK